jgi:hypothetical protein
MKAARIIKPKEALQVEDLETPKPKGSQVLVKVLSSGVCHSDIHLWEGGYEGPRGQFLKTTDRGVKYPYSFDQISGFGKSQASNHIHRSTRQLITQSSAHMPLSLHHISTDINFGI